MEESEILRLNVGGHIYTTTRSTLVKYPDSMLGVMFKGDIPSKMDQDGNYFIDRDGQMFRYILNFCRSGKLCLPQHFTDYDLLENEADFYQIQPLITSITSSRQHAMKENLEVHYLEIVEVRTGTTATMPSKNSRVKTILLGRKEDLLALPSTLVGEEAAERLECKNGSNYVELEIFGSNVRIQLADFLSNSGWVNENSDLSSSSSLTKGQDTSILCIEQSYRDRWKIYKQK
ncbi:potassium channel regulatory protein-like [Saccostrea echinata]|uniref:potassium channel regulatory protein-like n=1 Tax=Saccostrea echinata TaxID=191078 RepID=UPI002A8282FB|nr:potassium channel regulatory protein-like [Saccostrea echinata]